MTIILFDIDGTLTESGAVITESMLNVIRKLYNMVDTTLGLVGGGTLDKIKFQMGSGIRYFKYIFAECGAIISIDNILVRENNMVNYCDRSLLNNIIKKALSMISDMPIIYNGHQIDFRKGLIYISPPGMQAGELERSYFMEMDKIYGLRKNLLSELKKLDPTDHFEILLGGAVGLAIHPKGWNKCQVIDYLKSIGINESIFYFGDRTEPDGNDYPIYSHPLVNGVSVINYQDTIDKVSKLFLILD